MSDYTPTTAMVRGRIIQHGGGWGFYGLAEFDRFVAALRAEWEADVEWEYGTRCPMPECTEPHLLEAGDGPPQPEESLWRRTKARDVPAGPWEPAPASPTREEN